jgi:hypothetical protein
MTEPAQRSAVARPSFLNVKFRNLNLEVSRMGICEWLVRTMVVVPGRYYCSVAHWLPDVVSSHGDARGRDAHVTVLAQAFKGSPSRL